MKPLLIFLIATTAVLTACQNSNANAPASEIIKNNDFKKADVNDLSQCKNRDFQGAPILNSNGYKGPETYGFQTDENNNIDITFWDKTSVCISGEEQIRFYGVYKTDFSFLDETHFVLIQDDQLTPIEMDGPLKKVCSNGMCKFQVELIADQIVKITLQSGNMIYSKTFETENGIKIPTYNPYKKEGQK